MPPVLVRSWHTENPECPLATFENFSKSTRPSGDGGGDGDIDDHLYDQPLPFMRNLRVREMLRKVKIILNFANIIVI